MHGVTQKIIKAMEPYVGRLRVAIEKSDQFKLATCGLIREGPNVFTVGISCDPSSYPISDVRYSFVCVGITNPEALDAKFTLSVGWHRSNIAGNHDGFSIWEANAGPFALMDESNIQELVDEFPRMEMAMLRGLRRGRPPSRLAITWGLLTNRCQPPKKYRIAT